MLFFSDLPELTLMSTFERSGQIMKNTLKVQWVALPLLCALLTFGCAKTPAPAPVTTPENPTETVMPGDSVTGIRGTGMSEAAVGEQPMNQNEMQVEGLERVHFDFDQFTLSPEARDTLAKNAAYLQANPDLKVRIEGHCDERGSDEYNLALGERRAKAAKDYLVSLGVAENRLDIISYGEEMPLDPGHNEEAWAKNRRDEFKAVR
jgi:peptidoglycan-associated lipoprotein